MARIRWGRMKSIHAANFVAVKTLENTGDKVKSVGGSASETRGSEPKGKRDSPKE